MNADGSDQRVLASLGGSGAVFPSFSHNGNELCFNSHGAPARHLYREHSRNRADEPDRDEPDRAQGDNLRCDWSPKSNSIAFGSISATATKRSTS